MRVIRTAAGVLALPSVTSIYVGTMIIEAERPASRIKHLLYEHQQAIERQHENPEGFKASLLAA